MENTKKTYRASVEPIRTKSIKSTKSIGTRREIQNFRYLVVPPDGGWGWLVVAASFFVNFVADGTMYTFGLFLPEITSEFHSRVSTMTLANSLMTGLYYMTGPIVCAMINRLTFRVVGCIGAVLTTICFIGVSFARSDIQYICIYGVIGGIGFSMCYLPAILVVGFYFERWRAAAMSIAVCGSSIGIIVFPPIFETLLDNENWRFKYRVIAGFSGLTFFCSLLYKPIKPIKIIDDTKSVLKFETKVMSAMSTVSEKLPFNKMRNIDFPTTAEAGAQEYLSEFSTSNTLIGLSRMSLESIVYVSTIGFVRTTKSSDTIKIRGCCGVCKRCTKKRIFCRNILPSRPMYKDDIFFQGSLAVLPKYGQKAESNLRLHQTVDYNMNVTRLATTRDINQEGKCVCCPESVVRTLATMLDFSLMKSPALLLLLISGIFTYIGFYVPYTFIVQRCIEFGMSPLVAPYIISIMGAASTIGRILCGVVTMSRYMTTNLVNVIGLLVAGFSTVALIFIVHPIGQFVYGAVFALFIACTPALRTIMIVELVGLEKLTNAVGLVQLFQGIACLIGQPVASILLEKTKDYRPPLIFAGLSIAISGFLLIPLPRIIKWEKNQVLKKEQNIRKEIEEKVAKANAPKHIKK